MGKRERRAHRLYFNAGHDCPVIYFFLAFAVKKIALGVAYALWEGIGILLITLFSVLLFDESLSLLKIAGLTTLVIGIVLIKSGTQKKASSKQEVAHAAV